MLGYQITVSAAGKDIGRWQGWLGWIDGLQDAGLATCTGDGYPFHYLTTIGASREHLVNPSHDRGVLLREPGQSVTAGWRDTPEGRGLTWVDAQAVESLPPDTEVEVTAWDMS